MKLNTHKNGWHEPSKSHVKTAEPSPSCAELTGAVEADAGMWPLTLDDINGDIERIITKAITPYIDDSHPLFHFDDLRAECLAKLAKVLHDGCLSKCLTPVGKFSYLKRCFCNHVRSLVQKHMFSAKRTGVVYSQRKPGPGTDAVSAHKPHHVSIDDAEVDFQLGAYDASFRLIEFMEELAAGLSGKEDATLNYLMNERAVLPNEGNGTSATIASVKQLVPNGFNAARAKLLKKGRAILMNRTIAVIEKCSFNWDQVNWELRNIDIAAIWGKKEQTVCRMRHRKQHGRAQKVAPEVYQQKLVAEKAKAKAFGQSHPTNETQSSDPSKVTE